MNDNELLAATLYGRFAIRTKSGLDITPTGKKSQALLAILLTSEDGSRGRGWLQDTLWSDRGREQSAASLRQSLSEIRKSFGNYSDVLVADRQYVGLVKERVSLGDHLDTSRGEFLEGLDIRDPVFGRWLAEMRRRHARRVLGAAMPTSASVAAGIRSNVVLRTESPPGSSNALDEHLLSDLISKSLREFASIETLCDPTPLAHPGTLSISLQSFAPADGTTGMRISIEDMDGRKIWSDAAQSRSVEVPISDDVEMLGLSNRAVGYVVDTVEQDCTMRSGSLDANQLSCLAIQKMFGLRDCDLVEADRLLSDAYEIERRGLFQAWRAYLFAIQFVERRCADADALVEQADQCCNYALEFEPNNSFVLAAVANARRVLTKNYIQSGELAKMAVKANPANPLAWWSLSAAELYCDDVEGAHHSAVIAQSLARGTRFQYWGDFQRSLTAAVTGRFEESVRMGEASQALAPNFKPPARYLTAIYALTGRKNMAERSATRLKAIEDDFSIDRLISDPAYPVSLMRNKDLIDRERLQALEVE